MSNETNSLHEKEYLRVSAQSRPAAVAGAIASVMREKGHAEVQAIGASAVNQAVKAIAIARGYLEQDEMDLVIAPSFTEINIEGNKRTGIYMEIYRRHMDRIILTDAIE